MSRVLWVLVGLLIGLGGSRNASAMSHPVQASVLLLAVVGMGVTWWAAFRGKGAAVANAVANAEARAEVEFAAVLESKAQALAQNAVHLYLSDPGVAGQLVGTIAQEVGGRHAVRIAERRTADDAELGADSIGVAPLDRVVEGILL